VRVRTIRGAYFDKSRAALLQNVRDAKPAANLYELATRNDYLTADSKRCKDQQNSCSVVIDDYTRGSPGKACQQVTTMLMAGAAASRLQLVFQV